MPKLDAIFNSEQISVEHPLLQYIDDNAFQREDIRIEVNRPMEVLGYPSAQLIVHLTRNGTDLPPQEYSWDDDLNIALIDRGYRAPTIEKEKVRFALAIRARLRKVASRFGDGYFNGVIVKFVKDGPLSEFDDVRGVLAGISVNLAEESGRSFGYCRDMIRQVLHDRATELTRKLQYDRDTAEVILAGAVAVYLDERFTVSMRQRLGWTTTANK